MSDEPALTGFPEQIQVAPAVIRADIRIGSPVGAGVGCLGVDKLDQASREMVPHKARLVYRLLIVRRWCAPALDPVVNRLPANVTKGVLRGHTVRFQDGILGENGDEILRPQPIPRHGIAGHGVADALPRHQFGMVHGLNPVAGSRE